jgi:hypothetical protein
VHPFGDFVHGQEPFALGSLSRADSANVDSQEHVTSLADTMQSAGGTVIKPSHLDNSAVYSTPTSMIPTA